MRTFLILLLVVFYIIFTLPLLLIFYLIAKKNPCKAERCVHACISWLLNRIKDLAGTKVVTKGLENVPDDSPVMYVGNHRSYFDIIFTYPLCKLPTSYIAKSELKKLPSFALWGTLMRAIFFDRNDIKSSLKMIRIGIDNLKTDTSVFIFPEGTRKKGNSLLPLLDFPDGSFKLASKSGAPIIPVAMKNTADVWEAHLPWVKKTTVTITYGKPIYINNMPTESRKHPGAYVKKLMEEMLA